MNLLIENARLFCGAGKPAFRGALRIEGQVIAALGERLAPLRGESVLDARGRVVMPGFVDAHTHAAFAGDRLDEFELALRGKSYLEILEAGGGICTRLVAHGDGTGQHAVDDQHGDGLAVVVQRRRGGLHLCGQGDALGGGLRRGEEDFLALDGGRHTLAAQSARTGRDGRPDGRVRNGIIPSLGSPWEPARAPTVRCIASRSRFRAFTGSVSK